VSASYLPDGDVVVELRGSEHPLQMADVAGVLGRFRDVELALFSWLGRTSRSLESAEEVVWASGASLRAAWRATQLEQLLPVSVGLGRTEAPSPSPTVATATALEALERLVPSDPPGSGFAAGLASAWYAALLDAYRYRLRWLSAAADGPLERLLERLLADLGAEKQLCEVFGSPGRDA